MPDYFFDSSAVVKRYLNETGTAWVANPFNPATGNQIYIARIAGVEVVAAIARRRAGKSVPLKDAANAIAEFKREFNSEYLIVEMTPNLIDKAMNLTDTYHLRSYDATHLAAAIGTNNLLRASNLLPLTLVSADLELNRAAIAEGLTVEDPNAHP
ncbi:MAG: type II toxin-antitoxin system VapC family toxin [Acidobacteriota bacterium]